MRISAALQRVNVIPKIASLTGSILILAVEGSRTLKIQWPTIKILVLFYRLPGWIT